MLSYLAAGAWAPACCYRDDSSKNEGEPLPNIAKCPLPVHVCRSKRFLLKFPIDHKDIPIQVRLSKYNTVL